MFNCRNCGGKGDVIDLVRFVDGIDFIAAVEKLAGKQPSNANGHGTNTKTASSIYNDAEDKPYLKVDRYEKAGGGKSYPQFHWDGAQWISGKPKGPKIPYRLPELLDSDRTEPGWITEGEKCADAVAKLGLTATTASEGAGKWTADLNDWFRERIAYILPDNDELGRKHAQQVAHTSTVSLARYGSSLCPISSTRRMSTIGSNAAALAISSTK